MKKQMPCLYKKEINCDIFNDTMNCWYISRIDCLKMKRKREEKSHENI